MSNYIPINIGGKPLNTSVNRINTTELDGKYVNQYGDTMNGELDMNNNSIKNLAEPIDDRDAVNKKYVDDNTIEIYDNNKKGYKISLMKERDSNDCSFWCHGDNTGNVLILNSNLAVQFNINNSSQVVISDNNIDFKNKKISGVRTPINDDECANKHYVDNITMKPRVIEEFIQSGNSRSFETYNPAWYSVRIYVTIYGYYFSVDILRIQINKVFPIKHKEDVFSGESEYIYNYYGEVFIRDVSDDSFTVEAKNFGYTIDNTKFTRTDNSDIYGVTSVVIF